LQGSAVNAKAIFFQRTCGSRAVSPKDIEMDLSYGEMMNSPLEDFDRALGQVFLPLLKQQEEWGKCRGDADANALFESAASLRKTLDEAILNVSAGKSYIASAAGWLFTIHWVPGVRLELPEDTSWAENETNSKTQASMAKNTDFVQSFIELIGRWCIQVEQLLKDSAEGVPDRKNKDDGPRSELLFWRQRAHKFSTIIDQLQIKECKIILGVLREAKATDEAAYRALKSWRAIDNEITDAANEAKDNVKYLGTLDKYMCVLYEGTTAELTDSLQPLLHNIKMMQQISRYYNTEQRMTTLFVKITNQMINNCRLNVLKNGKPWEQNPEVLVENMKVFSERSVLPRVICTALCSGV